MSGHPPRWNHNLHYHRVILAAVPDGARRSLDVGCGMDAAAALSRMGELPAPRGTLAIVGLARHVPPGVRYRRLLLWRYSLVWTKPA